MSSTSIDRYVSAVLRAMPRSVSRRKRGEVERELRSLIGDEIDGRVAAGEQLASAERSALRELGDPERLANQYAPDSRVLLSPRVFVTWARAAIWTCAIVLPIVYVVLLVVRVVHGDNLGAVVFLPLGATITVAMYLLVGLTALFALVDRHDAWLGSGLAGPITGPVPGSGAEGAEPGAEGAGPAEQP